MSPTSRNTLMIGGALILIALMLVCGPLSGRLGGGGPNVEQAPAVAAGPPADDESVDSNQGDALKVAALGALAGASLGEVAADGAAGTAGKHHDPCAHEDGMDDDARETDCPPVANTANTANTDVGSAFVPTVIGAAVAGAGVAMGTEIADGIGGGSMASTAPSTTPSTTPLDVKRIAPPVSAGPPSIPIAGPGIADVIGMVAVSTLGSQAAAGQFDDAIVDASKSGVGPAGKVVNRFAPPVAAPPDSSIQVASNLTPRIVILPCDQPGSGCRNVFQPQPIVMPPPPPPAGGNPPIVPGGRRPRP